jgi:hypothetical protein
LFGPCSDGGPAGGFLTKPVAFFYRRGGCASSGEQRSGRGINREIRKIRKKRDQPQGDQGVREENKESRFTEIKSSVLKLPELAELLVIFPSLISPISL